ncbi:uncharacterized protein LOC124168315 [Ischnura elegans]|uniref:uncharacterized protein LOC124168315 n=1 Tax=Ischnura elegans TaxID=197161 RepID=UPI001ED87666|nr:uncharacterized protein LOC124168315 [Ischnura elegans]
MCKEFACARVNTNIFLVFFMVGRKCVMPFFTLYLKYLRLTSLEVGIVRGSQSWIAMIFIPIWVCFVKRSRESLKTRVLLLISVFLTASMYSCLVFVPPIGEVYDVTHCDSMRSGNHELVVIIPDSSQKDSHGQGFLFSNPTANSTKNNSSASISFKPNVSSSDSGKVNERTNGAPPLLQVPGLNAVTIRTQPLQSFKPQSTIDLIPTPNPEHDLASGDQTSGLATPPSESDVNVLGKVEEYSSGDTKWKTDPYEEMVDQLIQEYEPDNHKNSFSSKGITDQKYPFKSHKKHMHLPPALKNGLRNEWSFGRIGKVDNADEEKEDMYLGGKEDDDDMYQIDNDWSRLSALVKTGIESGRGLELENSLPNIRKAFRDRSRGEQWGKEVNRDDGNQIIDNRNWGTSSHRKIPVNNNFHIDHSEQETSPEDDDIPTPKLIPKYDWIRKRGYLGSHYGSQSRFSRSLLSNEHIDVIVRPVGQGGLDSVDKTEDAGPLAFRTVLLLSGVAELFACMPVSAVTSLWWLHLDDAEHTEQFGEHRPHALLASVPAIMALVVAISKSPCSLIVGPHQITLHLLAAATVLLSSIPLILALPLGPASKAWRRASDASGGTVTSHRGYVSGHQILVILTAMLGGCVSAAAGEYVFWHLEGLSGFPHNYDLLFGGSVASGALIEALITVVLGGRWSSRMTNMAGPLGLLLLSAYLGSAAMLRDAWVFVALGGLLGGSQALIYRTLYGAHQGPGDITSGQATGWRFGYGLGCFVSGFVAEVFGTKILFWSAAGVAAVWAILSACCYKLILPPMSASLLRVQLGQKGLRSRRRHKRLYSRLLFPPEDGELLLKSRSKGASSSAEDGVEVEMEEESDWLERALREDAAGLRTAPANL